jgi:hypothetical protein
MSLPLRLIFALRGMTFGRSFERQVADPEKAQLRFLEALLEREKDTAFGREHGFAQLKGREDYRRAVPIRDYEGFRPWVDRLTDGEDHVLTRERPWMFATTSGTTDLPKLIPVTNAWKKATTSLMSLWIARAQQDHPGILRHRILTMVSPAIEGYAACGLPIGSVSGVTRRNMPWLLRRAYASPYEVMEILDYDARYKVAIRMGYATQVSMMATPNPSTLLRLAETGAVEAAQVIRSIHDGTLGFELTAENSPHQDAQQAIADSLQARLRPNPKRAKTLDALLEEHGVLRPRDVWPHLAILGCWLGGSAGIQSEKLREWYGEVPMRDIGFRATEGTMTLPLADNTASGVPCLSSGYYEFVPEDDIEQECPATLLSHELEQGKRYYILLTTAAGLYRYDINDIVEVQGEYRGCPMFAFARKGRDMANITGEKIHVNQVLIAAERAVATSGLEWTQVQMIPDVDNSRYDLLVEPTIPEPGDQSLLRFSAALDQELSRCNDEYRQKRKSRRLHQPRVFEMKSGWYQRRWRADVVTRGKRDSQYKWPVIGLDWDQETREEVATAVAVATLPEEDLTQALVLPGHPGEQASIAGTVIDRPPGFDGPEPDEETTVLDSDSPGPEDETDG